MAESVGIADLFATLGVRVAAPQWSQAQDAIAKAQGALQGLDRAADKVGASSKAAAATKRVADRQERQAAQASKAIRSLEREEQRAEAVKLRGIARSDAVQQRASAARTRELAKFKKASAEFSEGVMMSGLQVAGGLAAAAVAFGVYLGGKAVKEGVELNATLEDSKNKVAGLMALAKHSDFNAELANAGVLMTNLERAAAKLPGETSDYVNMLSLIAQPVSQAKLGLKELEQLTISATSTALTMHIDPGQAARDIEGALNGVFNSRDRFTGPLLAARGFSGEEGRSRFNQLSADKRAKEVMAAFDAPQLKDMGAALGKSFSGQLSTAEDAWHRFERGVTTQLFEALTDKLVKLNEWLDKNEVKIKETADVIGEKLGKAFEIIVDVVTWIGENWEAIWTVIKISVGVVLSPFILLGAAIYAIIRGVIWLVKGFIELGSIARKVGSAIVDAFDFVLNGIAELPIVSQLIDAYNFFAGKSKPSANRQAADKQQVDEGGGRRAAIPATKEEEGLIKSGALPSSSRYIRRPAGAAAAPPEVKRGPSDESTGAMFMPTLPGSRSAYAMNIDVGGISVTSNASDPAAVAQEITKAFDERFGYHLRRTMDEVA